MIKYFFWLPLFFFAYPNGLLAQNKNLLENGGFEDFNEPLNYNTSWLALSDWKNPNPTSTQDSALAATPDYLNVRGEDFYTHLPESFFGTVYPHSGMGVIGLVTYNSTWKNGREYIFAKLKKPLQKGLKYELTFWVTNGEGNFYGEYAANGFGALLTTEKPVQKGHGLISAYPQAEISEVFFDKKWRKYSFQIIADKPYQYLTLGCFREDYQIKQSHYLKHTKPDSAEHFSYLFIDDISLMEVNTKPQSPVAMDEIITKMEENAPKEEVKPKISKEVPRQLEGRRVDKQNTLSVENDKLTLTIYDSRAEDQDTISLSFNGQWLIERQMVRKKPFVLEVDLLPDANNTLIFFAHNLGAIPPNTAMLMVDDGKTKQKIQVQSDLKKCGAIQLRRRD